jgi:hypothetical protein
MDAGEAVTRHVMVGFSDPADGNQAEAAAVSETTTTAGRAAATATGPLALDAGDGVTPSRQQPHGVANHVSAKCLDGPFHRSVRTTRNCKSGRAALRTAKNNSCPNCVLQSLTMIRKGLWGVQFQVRVSVMGHNRIHDLENIGSAVPSDER